MSNVLTIIRIIGTIPLIILINNNGITFASFIIFILLGITDFLDGYLARKYNNCTEFGKVADGVADKFLMIGVSIVLLVKNIIPYWTLIIFFRDICSCIFALYYAKSKKIILKSNIYGKLKTTLHILSISLTLLIGKWTLFSSILLIIAIILFIPEILYVYNITKNK